MKWPRAMLCARTAGRTIVQCYRRTIIAIAWSSWRHFCPVPLVLWSLPLIIVMIHHFILQPAIEPVQNTNCCWRICYWCCHSTSITDSVRWCPYVWHHDVQLHTHLVHTCSVRFAVANECFTSPRESKRHAIFSLDLSISNWNLSVNTIWHSLTHRARVLTQIGFCENSSCTWSTYEMSHRFEYKTI